MDYIEFASKIKTKYPQYGDMDDRDLAERMVAKYPQYSDVSFEEAEYAGSQWQQLTSGSAQETEQEPTAKKELGLAGRLGQRFENVRQAVTEPQKAYQRPISGLFVGAGEALGGIADIAFTAGQKAVPALQKASAFPISPAGIFSSAAGEIGRRVGKKVIPEEAVQAIGRGIGGAIGGVAESTGIGKILEEKESGTGFFAKLPPKEEMEKPLRAVGYLGEIITAIPTGAAAKKVVSNIIPEQTIDEAFDLATKKGIAKGIKPVKVKGGSLAKHGNVARFRDDAQEAVKIISRNKSNLNLVDEITGEIIEMPRSNAELGQAIQQTKNNIFETYDAIAVNAGQKGAKFSVEPINEMMDKYIADIANDPIAREYMANMKVRISDLDGATPKQVQERIRQYNSGLKGFGTITGAEAEKIRVEASVAEAMRQELDNTMLSVGEEGYKEYKNAYSKLKSIENEVLHRAKVQARQSEHGLTSIASVFPGMDIVYGLLTQNPATVAKGVAGKAGLNFIKKANDPDRAIKKMFEIAYKWADTQNPLITKGARGIPEISFESPAFARAGVPIEKMIREESAIKEAKEAASQAERLTTKAQADIGRMETIGAIRGLRPQYRVNPNVEAMRRYQLGRITPGL